MSKPARTVGPEPAIEVMKLTRWFAEMVALNELTLSVPGGERLFLTALGFFIATFVVRGITFAIHRLQVHHTEQAQRRTCLGWRNTR